MRWLLPLLLLAACPQSGPGGPQQGERRTTSVLVASPEAGEQHDEEGAFPIPGVPATAPDGPWEDRRGEQVMIRGEFRGGRPVGAWSSWYASGSKRVEGVLVDGVPDGVWRTWYEDGTLREVGGYAGGRPAGDWQLFYATGEPFERMSHRSGEPDGTWTIHWPNGAVADEMTWVLGVQTGPEVSYATDGHKVASGAFTGGVATGTWTCFDEAGPRTIEPPASPTTPRAACGGGPGPSLPPAPGTEPADDFVTRNPKLEDG